MPLDLSGLSRLFPKRLTTILVAVFAGFFLNPQLSMAQVVTSISPTAGPLGGGTSVTITGSGFTGATAVTFGVTPATSFIFNSDTSVTAVSPAESAGTVDVTVTVISTSATSPADQFTYEPPPVVTGLNPTAGPDFGGTSVTITGTSFTDASAVDFGITAATSFTVINATTIVAIAPPKPVGVVDITVTTPVGTSGIVVADRFGFVLPPTPALGEWSMIALALLLAGAGYLALRRTAGRRTA